MEGILLKAGSFLLIILASAITSRLKAASPAVVKP